MADEQNLQNRTTQRAGVANPGDCVNFGRPVCYTVRSRRRRSKPDYVGPNKLEPTDMDYVGFKKVNEFILGSDKIQQYYRYFGRKDSRKDQFLPPGFILEEEELDFHCYPDRADAILQHDALLYSKLKDSRIHRWIRLKKRHPNSSGIDRMGIQADISGFEALYDMTHPRGRSSYQKIVETWVSMEVFILAYYPACLWATWLNQFAALEDDVQWSESVPPEIINSYMRAYGAKKGELITVNADVQVPGRGAVYSTLKNQLSRIAAFQSSIGHRHLSYDLHREPTIAHVLQNARKNVNKNNHDKELRAITYNVVLSLPYICKGIII